MSIHIKPIFVALALLATLLTSNAQTIDKITAIESLISSTRETIVAPDSPAIRAALGPVKSANKTVPEAQWLEFQTNVISIMREELLKDGSTAYIKMKTRLQVLSLEEVVAMDAMLRSPAYKKYQAAIAEQEITDGVMGSLMAAWPRIAEIARQAGIRVQ